MLIPAPADLYSKASNITTLRADCAEDFACIDAEILYDFSKSDSQMSEHQLEEEKFRLQHFDSMR